ncbi:Retrovirus-related Pol polyprotein from transposon RE2 [Vitis vinifera]|uniref:Retrovirus-related Pol polyprotein from transposon RE2 n=1 Tax=Vitis vinifera TaxID=29760 RepID=A0A438JD77_VITVI|nr:Retrovirus-related Pol polyprotein from transposon RE2 [Vitis vinifera]
MAFNASSPVATASSHNKPRHERPICTHCGLTGHTIDRCYKLHGFPPGYKPKGKAQTQMAQTSPLQSQSTSPRSFTEPLKGIHYFPSAAAATVGSFPPLVSLPSNQVQQLIAYLSTHLQQQTIDPFESPSTSGPSISQIYGATHHVCCNISLFSHSRLVHNTTVTIPNGHVVAINVYYLTIVDDCTRATWVYLLCAKADVLTGYKLLDLESNKIYISRNVIFHESLFPFAHSAVSSDVVDFFNDHVLPKPIQSISEPSCSQPNMSSSYSPKCISSPDSIQTALRPRRVTTKPTYLSDYHCYLTKHAIESQVWCDAMNIELQALESNDTWYKARFVAKGFTQQEGIDYLDTFSLVAKLVTVKMLLSLATIHGWSLTQLDVTNAFLHGDLMEEVYMSLPPGYTCHEGEHLPPNAVCRLHNDHTLFTKHQDTSFLALLIYIDGIIIASNDQLAVDTLKHALNCKFKMKDLGPLRYFLGLEVA